MPPHNFCVHAFTPVSPPLRSNEKSTRLSLCVYIHSHTNALDVVTPHEGLMKLQETVQRKVLHKFQQEELVEELSHHTIHKTGKPKLTDLVQNRQYQTLTESYIQVNIR